MATNKNSKKWPWWKVLLWAYSVLYILFWLIVMVAVILFPAEPTPTDYVATTVMGVMFIPALLFLVIEGIEHLS